MSSLSTLKFTNSKRQMGQSPQIVRRMKLSTKLDEQIRLAKAEQSGSEFSLKRMKTVKDKLTGDIQRVEMHKKLKPWWWSDDKGKLCITIRYGARVIEIVEGKSAVQAENIAEVITALQLIKSAVESGELDKPIEAVNNKSSSKIKNTISESEVPVESSKLVNPAPTAMEKRPTLRLPSKVV